MTATIGMILGLSLSSSLQRSVLRSVLNERGVEAQVVQSVLDDVLFVRGLQGELKELVVRGYVESLAYSHGEQLHTGVRSFADYFIGFSFVCSALAFFVSWSVWEGDLT